jgi:hypothetical protein
MRLSDPVPGVPFYGGGHRGKCPVEAVEMMQFFSRLRREYPDTLGVLALHPRNEQLLRGGQFSSVARHRAEGMAKGAADIIIPGNPAFVCEMKRQDPTKSQWQDGQRDYLAAARDAGCFACVAFGADAAWSAFQDWQSGVARRR